MPMKAISVGLEKEALVIRPQDKSIFNYLQYVDKSNALATDFRERDVPYYENCMLYHGTQFLAYVSMEDLEAMIPAVHAKVAYLVEVRGGEESFIYSIDEAFFDDTCVGAYLNEYHEISPIIQSGKALWTITDIQITLVNSVVTEKCQALSKREASLYYNHFKPLMRELGANAFTFGTDSIYFETKDETIQYNSHLTQELNRWRR